MTGPPHCASKGLCSFTAALRAPALPYWAASYRLPVPNDSSALLREALASDTAAANPVYRCGRDALAWRVMP